MTRQELARLFEIRDRDIHITDTSLWVDPQRKRDFAVISHAHSDHTARHKKVIISKNCLPLYRHRVGNVEAETHDFGEPFQVGGARITLLPAGHILGSSQILIERDGLSLLYSGDFKLREGLTAEKIEVRHADALIVESTYGLPHYRFPAREEVVRQLAEFLRLTHEEGRTPVLLAYSLGKSQEAMRIASDLGYEPWVHETIYPIAKIYEQQGVKLGVYHRFSPEAWQARDRKSAKPRVVVAPPGFRNMGILDAIGPRRSAFLSGFALDRETRYGYRVDVCIPLSDHADFAELIAYVRQVNPKVVITTHGHDEFRPHLAKEGFQALPLHGPAQGMLFGNP